MPSCLGSSPSLSPSIARSLPTVSPYNFNPQILRWSENHRSLGLEPSIPKPQPTYSPRCRRCFGRRAPRPAGCDLEKQDPLQGKMAMSSKIQNPRTSKGLMLSEYISNPATWSHSIWLPANRPSERAPPLPPQQ